MALRIEWVGYGRPAGEALAAAIATAKAGDPLAPVTIVVPSNHVGVGTRRLLARGTYGSVSPKGSGIAAVSFLTPYRMAELLGSRSLAAAGRRPVSTPVLAAALRTALRADPGVFHSVAQHPATELALVEAYRELRDLTPAALHALAAQSPRAHDVVALHEAARAILQVDWYDEQDLIAAAVATLDSGDQFAATLGNVVVHLPQRLSLHSAALLAATAQQADTTVIAGTTGEERADAEVVTSLHRLGWEGVRPAQATGQPIVSADRTRFVTCSDADDEVRVAVRTVIEATRDGVALDRIAILHASPDPYARLVHEHLAAAGIGVNGSSVIPLSARVAGRTMLELLALPASGFARDHVFAWLSAAPVRLGDRPAPVAAWERISRNAGIVGGRSDWVDRLATFADDKNAEAIRREADPDHASWALQLRTEATRARDLRDYVVGLIDELAELASAPRPWSEFADWARNRLTVALGETGRRGGWPSAERKAADQVDHALDRLAALDEVDGPVDLDVFQRTLELELESDLGRVGRLGEGVLVGGIAMGVGLDLDLVVIVGLVEGSFPSTVREDSLLPDAERAATNGELALRGQRTHRQHRELLATLAGAERHLLAVPRGDLRKSNERVPSRFVLALASEIDGGDPWWSNDFLGADRTWLTHVASFDAGVRTLGFPATAQEHRLRALLAAAPARTDTAAMAIAVGPEMAAGAGVIRDRRSDRFTRFDGLVTGVEVPSPADRSVSPTGLERWAKCPFHYLLSEVLRAKVIEKPEEQLTITAMDKGNVIHESLEAFIRHALDRPEGVPAPDHAWSAADHDLLDGFAAEVCDRYESLGLVGRPIFWRTERRRIIADLHKIIEHDSARRRERRTRPVAAELGFGFGAAAIGTVPLDLPDGRSVHFRGSADRVDLADDGTIHVVDYKSGSVRKEKELSADDPDLKGTKLQLPVYAAAARVQQGLPGASVRAEYWFVSSKEKFKAFGYDVGDDLMEQFSQTLGVIVTGIEAGVFVNRPTSQVTSIFTDCHSCEPDGLGVTELQRAFARKRADPALAPYADFAEPPAEEPDDGT